MAGGTDIRKFFFATDIDRQIGFTRVLADDHAFVHRLCGLDKKASPLLQMPDSIGTGEPFAIGDHRAVLTRANGAAPGTIIVEDRVHDPGTSRLGEKTSTKA